MIAAAIAATPAAAERVLIQSPSGERGHGWLFGSIGTSLGECWLAVPRHVIEDPFSHDIADFAFTDRKGVSGHSMRPVAVSDVPGAQAAAGGSADLAFARVQFGREKGRCLSRLGLNELAYDTALRSGPDLTIMNLLPTSFGIFQTKVAAGGTGESDGLLALGPVDDATYSAFMKRGLSGSVAEATIGGEIVPFAMILEVNESRKGANALRFDKLRAAFELVERAEAQSSVEPDVARDYELLSFEGVATGEVPLPEVLGGSGGCWTAQPTDGQPAVRITLQIPESPSAVRGLELGQTRDCSAAEAQVSIDRRIDSSRDWTRLKDCKRDADGIDCPFELRGPQQVRINLVTRSEIGLAGLTLR